MHNVGSMTIFQRQTRDEGMSQDLLETDQGTEIYNAPAPQDLAAFVLKHIG